MFGRFAYILSATIVHYFVNFLYDGKFSLVMSVRIRQAVRKQPDTGYWKSLGGQAAPVPDFGGGLVDLLLEGDPFCLTLQLVAPAVASCYNLGNLEDSLVEVKGGSLYQESAGTGRAV